MVICRVAMLQAPSVLDLWLVRGYNHRRTEARRFGSRLGVTPLQADTPDTHYKDMLQHSH